MPAAWSLGTVLVKGNTGFPPARPRLVEEHRVRFALVGDGSPGLQPRLGEDGQKPLVDWIKEKGRLVDPARWRTATPDGADGRRAAEGVGTQLYDLRPADDGD
jgi:hypothetical protein